jgi:hypothetical protein
MSSAARINEVKLSCELFPNVTVLQTGQSPAFQETLG